MSQQSERKETINLINLLTFDHQLRHELKLIVLKSDPTKYQDFYEGQAYFMKVKLIAVGLGPLDNGGGGGI